MSYHPEILTLDDWNARMCGCCQMPTCESPILECQSQPMYLCAHVDYGTTNTQQVRYFKSRKTGCQVIGSAADSTNSRTFTSDQRNYRVETYGNTWTAGSECPAPIVDCNASGGWVEESYYLPPSGGRFIASRVEGTLSNYNGLPDPRYTGNPPAPILSNSSGCVPMRMIVTYMYDPVYAQTSPFNMIGSTLRSGFPTTAYQLSGDCYRPTWVTSQQIQYTTFNDYTEEIHQVAATTELDQLEMSTWENTPVNTLCVPTTFWGLRTQLISRVRYRWRIPPCHPGSYYKITWDEVIFPIDYTAWLGTVTNPIADPPPSMPTIVSKVWEWSGPAMGECDFENPTDYDTRLEDDTRASAWSQLVAPALGVLPSLGSSIEIRNLRIACYRSGYGQKMQPQGNYYSDEDLDQDGIIDTEEL